MTIRDITMCVTHAPQPIHFVDQFKDPGTRSSAPDFILLKRLPGQRDEPQPCCARTDLMDALFTLKI